MTVEKLQNPELQSSFAKELLLTTDEVYSAADQVLEQKRVEVLLAKPEDNSRSDIYVNIPVTHDEIALKGDAHYLSDGSGYFSTDEFEWRDETGKLKEAETVQESVRNKIAEELAPWYLTDTLLESKIDGEGHLSQAFELLIGGKKIDMLNFSEKNRVSQDQLEQIRQTLAKAVNTGGAAITDSVSGIAIVSHADLNSGREDGLNAVGKYQNYNQLLLLSDKLLEANEDEKDRYGLDVNASPLETTLAHELGHAAQNLYWDTHANALGWKNESYKDVVDEYGALRSGTRHMLGRPAAIQTVFKDGSFVDVSLGEIVDPDSTGGIKPNTWYGGTQAMEDFAESSVPYFLEGRQTDKIDPIRANSISTTLQEKNVANQTELGPYIVEAREIKPNELEKNLPAMPKQELKVKISAVIAPTDAAPEKIIKQVVDDYGNQVYASTIKR